MDNPYRSPQVQSSEAALGLTLPDSTARPRYPLVARYWAASVDLLLACISVIVIGSRLSDYGPIIEGVGVVAIYLAYFFVAEALFARTPGKWLMGIKIVNITGERCTLWQILLRSATRLFEVNPVLLGGLPACLCIVATRCKQRLGDKLAGTLVVKDST